MTGRQSDPADIRDYYGLEHRIVAIETRTDNTQQDMLEIKQIQKEDKAEVQKAIKDLASAQQNLANSLAKMEAGISTIVKLLMWGLPFFFSVFGGLWAYNIEIQNKLVRLTSTNEQLATVQHEHLAIQQRDQLRSITE